MTRLTRVALVIGLAVASLPAAAQDRPARSARTASIEFLAVGQGDAILIRSPEGKTALVDAGPSRHVVELLKQRGVEAIDLVVISHHHQDHYGGMSEVIKTYRPRVFLATDSSHTTPHYLRLLQLVRDSGMRAIFPTDAPRKLQLGSVLLTVLPQPPEDPEDENDNSIGIRLQHGAFSMLLTGDSQARSGHSGRRTRRT
jgi:competence protein ComEC